MFPVGTSAPSAIGEMQEYGGISGLAAKVSVSGGKEVLQYILNVSKDAVKGYRKAAIEEIGDTYKKITSLGEDLYDPEKYDKIVNIHKNMLRRLKEIQLTSLSKSINGLMVKNVTSLTNPTDLVHKTMFSTNCAKIGCDKEDSAYFIGLEAQERDFTAPRRIAATNLPPLREVLHFDSTDYGAILKTEPTVVQTGLVFERRNPQTTRAEFLKLGQNIPPVWRMILEPKGFVERDVDVEDILKAGGNDQASKVFLNSKGEKPAGFEIGELSVFLKYDEGLTFTDPIYELAKYFDDTEDSDDVDEKDVKEHEKMFLARDQVGDFLQFVDNEQQYQVMIDQLRVKMDEARRTIEDALEKAGCSYTKKDTGYIRDEDVDTRLVSTEFVADEDTYQAVLACLDEGKNMFISEAISMMGTLPPLNDYLLDQKSKSDNILKALETDNEELVQISDNVEPDAAFEQDIKSRRTDTEVVSRYGDEAEDEFEKNLKEFDKPYRARYF